MAFQTVAKAMELKTLIDNAHNYLPKIGRCISLEVDYRRRLIEDEDEDEDEEEDYEYKKQRKTTVSRGKKLEKLHDKLVEIYKTKGFRMASSGFERASISVLGKEFVSLRNISNLDVENWYRVGASSGFGNVLNQETQHDALVRSSRELDPSQFSVSQELLDDVALKWEKEFVPASVTVQPYKIVIYGPGDHFKFHRDTPAERLCGTFLISLFQDCDPSYAFELHQSGDYWIWSSKGGNGWCAFYPDIPHVVHPLHSGFRAILSFKIFAKETENPQEWGINMVVKMNAKSFADEIQELNRPLGILLNHHYGYDSKSMYGCDKLLIDELMGKGLQVEMKPVLVHFEGQGPCGCQYEEPEVSVRSMVYSLTEEALEFVRKCQEQNQVEEQYTESNTDLVFLDGHGREREGLWDKEEQAQIEYTGNESQPHSENSVYVRYAAIVMSKDTMA